MTVETIEMLFGVVVWMDQRMAFFWWGEDPPMRRGFFGGVGNGIRQCNVTYREIAALWCSVPAAE